MIDVAKISCSKFQSRNLEQGFVSIHFAILFLPSSVPSYRRYHPDYNAATGQKLSANGTTSSMRSSASKLSVAWRFLDERP